MDQLAHRPRCSARTGGNTCECGLVQHTLFGRERVALDVIQWARSVRRSWAETPRLRKQMSEAIDCSLTLLHHDIEELCKASAAFELLGDEEP